MLGEFSDPLVCRLEDGALYNEGLGMIMLKGDPLMRKVNEIINHVVEEGLYNYWISLDIYELKSASRKINLVHPLGRYYSFNLYHMQPAFYLLLMGWCLSALSFMVEVFYNRVLSNRK
jgi:hypothetical protein